MRNAKSVPWNWDAIYKVFGKPTREVGVLVIDYKPDDDHPNGVVIIENSKVAGYKTGTLYTVTATLNNEEGKHYYELSMDEISQDP